MEQETVYAQQTDRLFDRMFRRCKSVLRVIFVIINNVYCIPTYVVWMMMLYPVKKCNPELYFRIEGLFFHWLLAMVAMWSWSAGYDLVELGDDIRVCLEERTLVLANHQSTADVPLLMANFNAKKNVLPHLMWIMDRVFRYTNFGIVSVLHEDFFIVSGKNRREESLRSLAKHLHGSFIPRHRKWIVLFPEGGFLRKRRLASQRYAEKNNLPVLKNVSLPRVGAMRVIMENIGYPTDGNSMGDGEESEIARNQLKFTSDKRKVESEPSTSSSYSNSSFISDSSKIRWVLDITIAYPRGEPLDLRTIVTGSRPPCQTLLFYRLYKCSQIPIDKEEMTNWLYQIFQEKDQMLEKFYTTGVFPTREFSRSPAPERLVLQDNWRFFILHLFFITSTYVHYHMLSTVFSYMCCNFCMGPTCSHRDPIVLCDLKKLICCEVGLPSETKFTTNQPHPSSSYISRSLRYLQSEQTAHEPLIIREQAFPKRYSGHNDICFQPWK